MSKKTNSLHKRIKPAIQATETTEIFRFNEKISKIPGIIKLTLGEPDFNTPAHIKAAAIKAINENHSHYTEMAGTKEVRTAAAHYLSKKYDLIYDSNSEITLTTGVTEAVYDTLSAIVGSGDEVLIPTPVFPLYFPIIRMNGGKPIFIDTSKTDFLLSPDDLKHTLESHPNAKAIILNSPSNPTGMTYTKNQLIQLSSILEKYDIFVISDEIYSDLVFDNSYFSIARLLKDQTILLNGLSKSHAMTGWRVGLMCGPAELLAEISKIHELTVTSINSISQQAATEAFTNGLNDSSIMLKDYLTRRDFLYKELQNLGISCNKPSGSFYLFAKIPDGFEQNSEKFCLNLAYNAKVALIPGSHFGPGGEGYRVGSQ